MNQAEGQKKRVRSFFEQYDFDHQPSMRPWLAFIDDNKNLNGTSSKLASCFVSKISESATFLDFGCGNGWATIYILKRKPKAFGVGVEISPKLAREARKGAEEECLKERCDFVVCDCNRTPFINRAFDIIVEMNVLHHLPNIRDALNNIYQALKEWGYALVVEVVTNNLLVLLGRRLNAGFSLSFAPGVEMNFTSNQLVRFLGSAGFDIEKRSYDGYFLTTLKSIAGRYPKVTRVFPRAILLLLVHLEAALQRIPFLRQAGGQILFLCRKADSRGFLA